MVSCNDLSAAFDDFPIYDQKHFMVSLYTYGGVGAVSSSRACFSPANFTSGADTTGGTDALE